MKAWKVRSGGKGKDVSDAFWGKKVAAIGWGLGDLSRISTREEIKDKLRVEYPGQGERSLGNVAGSIHRFVNEIEVGDLILTPPTENRDSLIGQCQSHYKYLPKLLPKGYEDVREVNWLKRIPRSALSDGLRSSCSGEITVSDISKHIEEIETLLGEATNIPNEARWDEFVSQAREFVDSGRLESDEIEYKVEIGRKLAEAREAVLADADDWADLLKRALNPNDANFINWRLISNLNQWCVEYPDDALRTLQAIWTPNDSSVAERVRGFCEVLPQSVSRGAGTRLTVASVLLMGLDVQKYPPFRVTVFNQAYQRTGYGQPAQGADAAAVYEHALGFLDRFIEKASDRGLTLRHHLDGESLVWAIQDTPNEPPEDISVTIDPPPPTDPWAPEKIAAQAERLLWEPEHLRDIIDDLQEKGQVIFYGPPGTGKTYVAKAIAKQCQLNGGGFEIVQFHPSYSYEDFVQGFRPKLHEGQPGFDLVDGPLRRIAERAIDNPDATFILVIDELNRGNVAKVFGELYFLLEYRDEAVRLQYGGDGAGFSLPSNLWFICTMNTADRSIALMDAALRRRFYFAGFFPDEPPVQGLLRRWLVKHGQDTWVADLVDTANTTLDRDAGIGPSYFMGGQEPLDEGRVRRIWNRAVIPYVEEQCFGDAEKLRGLEFDVLRQQLDGPTPLADGPADSVDGEQVSNNANVDSERI